MNSKTRVGLWSLFAIAAYLLVVFAVYRVDVRRAFVLGENAGAEDFGATNAGFFHHLFIAGMIAFPLLVAFSAWRAKVRLSTVRLLFVAMLGFIFSVLTVAGWFLILKDPSGHYIDGFAKRVAASGIESNAVTWADQLQTNMFVITNGFGEVNFPPDKVPPFFAPLFGRMGTPEATVYCFSNGKPSGIVDIHVELAEFVRPVEMGISVVSNADTVVHDLPEVYDGRSSGKRLMVYWGGD